ncbi:MAG: tRNA guanosine(34) transglycosylase Tgt [Planctomycetota bacterium]|jgi:queuine tRNA-ribosyltransferase
MSGFEVLHEDSGSRARAGVIRTAHGEVSTPAFMPVGTAGAVKGIAPRQLEEIGAEMILANTYHLLLRPGVECVEQLGGLHRFVGWDKAILTDSGGYQVFSLSSLRKVDDMGVEFASHVDGSRMYLDAERATEVQNRLGADIIMCLDECPAFGCAESELKRAVERTIAWARRARRSHRGEGQSLFGIVQGGTDAELRSYCTSELVRVGFDGYAIGGLGVGEGPEEMIRTVLHTTKLLPESKPRYLMGVGTPADIIASVRAGVELFDCVLPTRNGRNAYAFTSGGPLRLRNNAHVGSDEAIESGCDCYCCRSFSRGTLRHFFNVGEMLGPILVSLHNLRFYQRLMSRIRENVAKGVFSDWAEEELSKYKEAYGGQAEDG